jgi:hypothetical protein
MAKINSRQKGAAGEREVAKILQQVVNEVALQCGYVSPTIRRNTEQSQIGGEDLTGLPWYSFEIKRCERVELDKWWQQTVTQAARKAAGSSSWDALAKGGWRRLADAGGGSAGVGQGEHAPAREAALDGSREGQAAGPVEVGSPSVGSEQAVRWPVFDRARCGMLPPPVWCFAGNAVSSPVAAGPSRGSIQVAGKGRSGDVGQRVPVLLWRVNGGEWYARTWLDVLDANNEKVRTVADLSLGVWLTLFRTELTARLTG